MIVWILRIFWAFYGCPTCGSDLKHFVFRSPYDYWHRTLHEWKCDLESDVDWNGVAHPKLKWSYGV